MNIDEDEIISVLGEGIEVFCLSKTHFIRALFLQSLMESIAFTGMTVTHSALKCPISFGGSVMNTTLCKQL